MFRGLNEVEQKTCLSIRPRISEENYIHILPGAGCYSSIGIPKICEGTDYLPQSNSLTVATVL